MLLQLLCMFCNVGTFPQRWRLSVRLMKRYKREEEWQERYTATCTGSEGKVWLYTEITDRHGGFSSRGIYFMNFYCRQQKKLKMKVFAFALLLLVAVTYGKHWEDLVKSGFVFELLWCSTVLLSSSCITGEALNCVSCVREAPDSGDCVETVDTCPPEMDACTTITYPAPYGEFCGHIISERTVLLTNWQKVFLMSLQRTLSTSPASRCWSVWSWDSLRVWRWAAATGTTATNKTAAPWDMECDPVKTQ